MEGVKNFFYEAFRDSGGKRSPLLVTEHEPEDCPPVVLTKREAKSKAFSLFSCFFKLDLL